MDRNTHECPYCGNIFRARLVKGPDDGSKPPCLECVFSGKGPISDEQLLKKEKKW